MKTNAFAFINSARSKDATRYFITEVYFDSEARRIVATDGYRLHFIELSEAEITAYGLIDSGYVALDEKRNTITYIKIDGQFPNYERVIPEYAPDMEKENMPTLDTHDLDATAPKFLVREKIVINLAFLRDLKKGAEKWRSAFNSSDKANRAVHFISEIDNRLHAIIMPMSQD